MKPFTWAMCSPVIVMTRQWPLGVIWTDGYR
jgi:hypothetical protein